MEHGTELIPTEFAAHRLQLVVSLFTSLLRIPVRDHWSTWLDILSGLSQTGSSFLLPLLSSPFSFLFLVSLFVLVGSPRSRFAIRSERFSGVVFFVSFFSIFSLSSLSLRELSCEFPGFSSSYQYFCATTISSHFPILIISIQNN